MRNRTRDSLEETNASSDSEQEQESKSEKFEVHLPCPHKD